MNLKKISKERVGAAITFGFFHSFFSGKIEALFSDKDKDKDKVESRCLKSCLTECYEHIYTSFITTVFPLFIRLNHSNLEAVMTDMEKHHFSDDTSPKILLRYACGSKAVYDTVVDEYKQQLYHLLEGKFQALSEYFKTCKPISSDDEVPVAKAIRAMVRVQILAYSMGIKSSNNVIKSPNQATIYRLMIQGMIVLLHTKEIYFTEENLEQMFHIACLNSENFKILMNEMNLAFEELVQ